MRSLSRVHIAKPDYGTEARDLFRVKISNFGHLEPAHQQLILTDYRTHLSAIVAHSDAKAQEFQKASGLPPAERPTFWKQSIIRDILPHVKMPG